MLISANSLVPCIFIFFSHVYHCNNTYITFLRISFPANYIPIFFSPEKPNICYMMNNEIEPMDTSSCVVSIFKKINAENKKKKSVHFNPFTISSIHYLYEDGPEAREARRGTLWLKLSEKCVKCEQSMVKQFGPMWQK